MAARRAGRQVERWAPAREAVEAGRIEGVELLARLFWLCRQQHRALDPGCPVLISDQTSNPPANATGVDKKQAVGIGTWDGLIALIPLEGQVTSGGVERKLNQTFVHVAEISLHYIDCGGQHMLLI
jgi:hypothetical protein